MRNINTITSLISSLVAILALLFSFYQHHTNNRTQIELKNYEVTFMEKQRLYSKFMENLSLQFKNSLSKNGELFVQGEQNLHNNQLLLEPFLTDPEIELLNTRIVEFQLITSAILKDSDTKSKIVKYGNDFYVKRMQLRSLLLKALFNKEPGPNLDNVTLDYSVKKSDR